MRLFFKYFIFLLIFVFSNTYSSFANEFKEKYIIEVGKIDIGKLFWNIRLSKKDYTITVKLQDKGLLSALYKFDGNYESSGYVTNGFLIPLNYKQFWLTKKKKRNIEIVFDNGLLTKIELFPEEKEHSRIEYIGIKNRLDPLSSFLNLLMDQDRSETIDGRRVYSMVVDKNKIVNDIRIKKVLIKNYINIWSDHKRNDLEYIEIDQELTNKIISMPSLVKIKFGGILFKLRKI